MTINFHRYFSTSLFKVLSFANASRKASEVFYVHLEPSLAQVISPVFVTLHSANFYDLSIRLPGPLVLSLWPDLRISMTMKLHDPLHLITMLTITSCRAYWVPLYSKPAFSSGSFTLKKCRLSPQLLLNYTIRQDAVGFID